MQQDTIIIGGGAAGMLAAIAACKRGRNVLLIEKKTRLGMKMLITGKGRCNITNNCDTDDFMRNVPNNSKFLFSSLGNFSTYDTINFFEGIGVPLKTERGRRVFPQSDRSLDVVNSLKRQLNLLGCRVVTNTVTSIIVDRETDGKCIVKGVKCGDDKYFSDTVLIATGGKSYPSTGSTGDGYRFAKQAGHSIKELSPSLIPLEIAEKYPRRMMGLSLKNIEVNAIDNKAEKTVFADRGEMLFTHFGVSGPLILSASAHMPNMSDGRYRLEIDLKPALSEEELDVRILRDFSEFQNRDFINSLSKLLPVKMIPTIVGLSGIPADIKVNQITREQRKALCNLLKSLPLTVKGFRPIEEAVITRGGVNVNEINPKTMQSKVCSGLFIAGELLDIDGYTGGYNLQIAFSTGYTAGKYL